MMLTRVTYGLVSALCGLGLVGCVNLGPLKTEPPKNYQLTGSAPPPVSPLASGSRTIAVTEGFIAAPYRTTAMAYQVQAYQVNYFANSRWQALPSNMVTAALANTLQGSGLFKGAVISPPYTGATDQSVQVNLLALIQEFDASQQHAVERVQVQLVVNDGKTGRLQAMHTFELSLPAAPNPQGGVVAANQALTQLLPQMQAFIYQQPLLKQ